MSDPSINVTLLLKRHTDGDSNALSELIPLLYKKLQHLASLLVLHIASQKGPEPFAMPHASSCEKPRSAGGFSLSVTFLVCSAF